MSGEGARDRGGTGCGCPEEEWCEVSGHRYQDYQRYDSLGSKNKGGRNSRTEEDQDQDQEGTDSDRCGKVGVTTGGRGTRDSNLKVPETRPTRRT